LIFEKDALSFHLLDVIYIDQENVSMHNVGRNFDALSFRINADTVLKTSKQSCSFGNDSIVYVPAGVEYDRLTKRDEMVVIHMHTFGYSSQKIERFTPKSPNRLGALFMNMLKVWQGKEKGYKHEAGAILYSIFREIYYEAADERKIDARILPSVEYIDNNYLSPDISVSEIAAQSNISEVYFRKLFKAHFGISPKKYIISARMRFAAGLMEQGYYSLKEIAERSGFNDYKYFSTEFKKETGLSPSKYCYNYNGASPAKEKAND